MTSLRHALSFFLFILIAMFLMDVSPRASAAPLLAGTFKITENTDLGNEMRITVEFALVNPGDLVITVTRVSLAGIASPGQLVSAACNLLVQPHSKSQISLQYVLDKRDFNAWSTWRHQQFLMSLEQTGGKPLASLVVLLRTQE